MNCCDSKSSAGPPWTKFGSAAAAEGIRKAARDAGVGTGAAESLATEDAGCALVHPARPNRLSAAITRDIFFMGVPVPLQAIQNSPINVKSRRRLKLLVGA